MISDLRRQARKRRRVCTNACYRTLAPRGPLRARPPHRHPSTSHGSPISQLACGRWLEVELDAKVAVVAQQVRREQRPRVEQQADPLRHDLDPKGGQPDRVGRRVVRVDRADGRRHAVDVRGLGRPAREEHGEVERARRHHQVVVPPRLLLHLVVRRRLLLRVRVERLLVWRSGVGADDLILGARRVPRRARERDGRDEQPDDDVERRVAAVREGVAAVVRV
mmetsp:Transcript_4898/g.14168  ORF Transcript_4898/g.14168 Transcript_4898/m.14168 type:complete len:222 (-) Transcript_4898:960-1625(-)